MLSSKTTRVCSSHAGTPRAAGERTSGPGSLHADDTTPMATIVAKTANRLIWAPAVIAGAALRSTASVSCQIYVGGSFGALVDSRWGRERPQTPGSFGAHASFDLIYGEASK